MKVFFCCSLSIVIFSFFLVGQVACDIVRDPFFLPLNKQQKPFNKLFLKGVMKIGRKIGALVDYAGQQKIVFKGDRLDCFLITSISMEGIVLKKGKKEITLFLKEKVSST